MAATGRLKGNTVTILDLKSGGPRLTIDTGMEVLGLRMTGSTIVVLGAGKVVTWNLPAGDYTPNARDRKSVV